MSDGPLARLDELAASIGGGGSARVALRRHSIDGRGRGHDEARLLVTFDDDVVYRTYISVGLESIDQVPKLTEEIEELVLQGARFALGSGSETDGDSFFCKGCNSSGFWTGGPSRPKVGLCPYCWGDFVVAGVTRAGEKAETLLRELEASRGTPEEVTDGVRDVLKKLILMHLVLTGNRGFGGEDGGESVTIA